MSETKTLHDKLIDIQQRLEVPKLRENSFGGFHYRSVEDIEVALKPLLKEHQLRLVLDDEVIAVGDRVYVKATAVLSNGEQLIQASAYAREAEKPKAKTDDAQLTGGCSSYARKYALQGLFLIDDGKSDPDTPAPKMAQAYGTDALSKAKQDLFKAFKKANITDSIDMMSSIQFAVGKDTVDTVADVQKVIDSLGDEVPTN